MFESIIMQAVANITAPVVPAGADPNVAYIGGIVTTAVISVIGLIKSGQLAQLIPLLKRDTKMAGQTSVAALQKSTEAKAVALKLAPEDKQELIAKVAEEVITGMQQVESVKLQQPEFNPEKLDIPRETFDTRPKPAEVQKRKDESNVLK